MATGGPGASAMPYIGSKISLITNSELRYEGVLVNINTASSTVTLQDVRMSGTEGRKAPQFVLPSTEIYDFIVFNGKDIKDLTVSEPGGFSIKEDPAVVAVNIPPHDLYRTNQPQQSAPKPRYTNPAYAPLLVHHHQLQQPPNAYLSSRNRQDYGSKNPYSQSKNEAVVGELLAQPNNSIKSQVAAAFDFEEANQKFVRNAEDSAKVATTAPVYDKNSSFFDNISCETLNRQRGRDSKLDREKQRELDAETFGPTAALSRGPRYFRRGQFANNRNARQPNRAQQGQGQQRAKSYLYRISNQQQQSQQSAAAGSYHVRAQ